MANNTFNRHLTQSQATQRFLNRKVRLNPWVNGGPTRLATLGLDTKREYTVTSFRFGGAGTRFVLKECPLVDQLYYWYFSLTDKPVTSRELASSTPAAPPPDKPITGTTDPVASTDLPDWKYYGFNSYEEMRQALGPSFGREGLK